MIKPDPEKYTHFERLLYLVGQLHRRFIEDPRAGAFWPAMAERLIEHFLCDRATLFLVRDGTIKSEFAAGLEQAIELEPGRGFAGLAAKEGKTLLSNDAPEDPRFDPSVDQTTGYKTRSLLAAPFFHDGKVVGVVELLNKPKGFTPADLREIEWLSSHVGFILRHMTLEEEKRRLEAEAADGSRLADLGLLLSGVTHDLGHPLTLILGRTDWLLTQAPPDSPLRPDLEKLLKSAADAQAIVRSLLEVARRAEFQPEPVDLGEAVAQTLALVDSTARMNGVRIANGVPPGLPRVWGSTEPLRQVFMNLVVNALHAMPQGGLLEVSAAAVDGWVRVRVKDSGAGIDPAHLPRVFERFFTTRGKKGTGLGLSTSLGLVHRCGGTVEARSGGASKGAEFTVVLKAWKRGDDPPPSRGNS